MARNQEIRIDFSQVAGKDQAREILANNNIESFLMVTNGVNIQMAGQKKVLVRDILLGISDREVGAAIKEFGKVKNIQIRVAGKWQSAVVEYNNQEEATRAVDQWSTMVRKNAVRIYSMVGTQKIIEQRKTWKAKLVGLPQNYTVHYLSTTLDQIKAQSCFIPRTSKNYTKMDCVYIGFDSKASHNNATKKPLVIDDTMVHWVPTNAKECHFCYQVEHLVSKCPILHKKKEGDTKKVTNNIRLAKLYVKRNVPEKNIKAFGRRLYANMAILRLSHNQNNTNPNNIQKPGTQGNNREEQLKKRVNQL
ncbi:hypothetical protein G9A89_016015 [Geosiphon pyriformis]|nr:hypothetical protein G9A89_016015 [Geosiphon pyriformis]